MKKLLISLCLLLSSAALQAQTTKGGLSIAPTVGLNLSTINLEVMGKTATFKPGAVLGATGEYGLNGKMSLSASLLFSMQGAKWSDMDYKQNLNCFNIPLMFNWYIRGGWQFNIGLQPGFLLSAKEVYDGESESVKDWANTLDVSIPFGISRQIQNFEGGLRICYGLSSVYKDEYVDGTARNIVMQVVFKYKFKIK